MSASRLNQRSLAGDGLPRRVGRVGKVHTQAALALRRARWAARGERVIVGPWSSEVGFELLYWIPFVRRILRESGVPPERVVVVSRGGASPWYGEVTAHYVDLLDWLSAQQLRQEHRDRIRVIGAEKQIALTPFEQGVLDRVREEIGEPGGRVLHPSMMYRRYRAVWMRRRAPIVAGRELEFEPITVRATPPADLAVGEYVVVKPYFSASFPASSENRDALHDLVQRLARHAPVVVLGSGGGLDDHEHPDLSGPNVMTIPATSPRTNLAEQTTIVRGARLLVATYGGFSYLGPFLGVPTCAFYSNDGFNPVHLEVLRDAERKLSGHMSSPGYMTFDIRHLPMMDRFAGDALPTPTRER